jgi:hypothetical protein
MKKDTKDAQDLPPLWTYYQVRWKFLTRLCASVPADPAMIQKWLESRQARIKPAGALSIEEINEEVLASIERGEGEADQSFSMLVFQRHGGALVERYGTVKAHAKDCARVLSNQYIGRIQGERAFSTWIANGLYLDPGQYWIPIRRPDGTPVTDADGAFDKAIHVRGPRGEPLSALKRFEFVEPPSVMEFTLMVLGRSVSETDLHHLFMYGGMHGYAGERGDGEGRYSYELERLDSGSERTRDPHVRRADAKV